MFKCDYYGMGYNVYMFFFSILLRDKSVNARSTNLRYYLSIYLSIYLYRFHVGMRLDVVR